MTRRIRVLQVTHDLGVGGLPRVVETLCRTIDPERFEVTALCLNFAGELADALMADGYRVEVLEQSRRKPDYLSSMRLVKFLRAHRFDVVHSHNTQPFLDAGIGAVMTPGTALIHTDHARDFPDKLRYMALEHLLSWRAFRVVGVSEHTTDNLHKYERISRRKLTTIENGIDGRAFEGPLDRPAVRASLGIPEGSLGVVFASRLEAQKDVPNLLHAFSMLARRVPELHLAIVGQGTLRSALEAQANELGLAGRVTFTGVRLDVPDILRASDIFVLPSAWEGLPMVILEALAAGCPIVSTAVGGVPSAVLDGETGVLVPPGDPAALAAGLERVARDEELRRRVAAEGRRLFDRRFSAEAMTRRYEALYVQACGPQTAPVG